LSRLSSDELARLRALDAVHVVQSLATHAKQDSSFHPVKATGTQRWHLSVGDAEFELLLSGPKFFDTRAKQGGGGAIDLVAHLFRLGFRDAVALLRRHGL
jgi:hypothetical protein